MIVRATDANGNTSVRQGTVDTLKRNVRVRFMEIRVTENGEKRSTNRGEITFVGGVNRKWQVKRGESKIKDGQRVHFSNQGQVELLGVRDPISFQVQGMERDRTGACFDSLADPPYVTNTGRAKKKCMKKVWNTAEATLDPESIFALDSSFEPGFEGAGTLDTRIYANRRGAQVLRRRARGRLDRVD